MIFPVKTEVTSSEGGVLLSFFDHPGRQPLEQVDLSRDEARSLLEDMIHELWPMYAGDLMEHLP